MFVFFLWVYKNKKKKDYQYVFNTQMKTMPLWCSCCVVYLQVKTTLVMSILAACTTSYCVAFAAFDVLDCIYNEMSRPVPHFSTININCNLQSRQPISYFLTICLYQQSSLSWCKIIAPSPVHLHTLRLMLDVSCCAYICRKITRSVACC